VFVPPTGKHRYVSPWLRSRQSPCITVRCGLPVASGCARLGKSQAPRFFAMDDADLLEVAVQRLDKTAQLTFIHMVGGGVNRSDSSTWCDSPRISTEFQPNKISAPEVSSEQHLTNKADSPAPDSVRWIHGAGLETTALEDQLPSVYFQQNVETMVARFAPKNSKAQGCERLPVCRARCIGGGDLGGNSALLTPSHRPGGQREAFK